MLEENKHDPGAEDGIFDESSDFPRDEDGRPGHALKKGKHKKKHEKHDKKVEMPECEYRELKEKSLKADEYMDSFLRIRAEFDNYRKRVNRERESITLFAVEELVTDFLGVLDNLERALSAAGCVEDFDSLHKGVEITLKDARKVLEKWGVSEVPALGEEFDPEKHEAFTIVDSDAEEEDEKVVEVLRKGYYLKEKLIRPSLVKVARRSENGQDNRY